MVLSVEEQVDIVSLVGACCIRDINESSKKNKNKFRKIYKLITSNMEAMQVYGKTLNNYMMSIDRDTAVYLEKNLRILGRF